MLRGSITKKEGYTVGGKNRTLLEEYPKGMRRGDFSIIGQKKIRRKQVLHKEVHNGGKETTEIGSKGSGSNEKGSSRASSL